MEPKEQKKEIRKQIAALKRSVPAEMRLEFSKTILEKLEQLPEFFNAKTVLLYYALPDEVQTEFFLQKWSRTGMERGECSGKRIVLPVVDGENLILKEYKPDKIEKGYQSILEPANTEIIDPSLIDLAIVPGVAFDASCNRLGRGKGFYDRLLPHINCKMIGLGYHFQMVDEIPVEEFDRPLDMVITDEKCFVTGLAPC